MIEDLRNPLLVGKWRERYTKAAQTRRIDASLGRAAYVL
jgi:hypothetical protein